MDQYNDHMLKPKSSTKQLQLHVASVYSQIAEMIKEKGDLQIQMPIEVPTAIQRVNLIKSVLAYLLDQMNTGVNNKALSHRDRQEHDNNIQCKNLQKLQGQIRNHIRTQQQLKLYQDGLQQKIEQYKKQKKQFDKKYDSVKKKYQEAKIGLSGGTQRISKLELQNQKLRGQLKQMKPISMGPSEPRKQLNRYESNKQNLSEWKNSNFNQRQKERNSIEKRPDSTQRMRVSVNVRSTKGIPISSKIVQEKAKQQKAKVLKNRLGF